jgi:lipid A 3-O-deacylase PagL
MNSFLTWLKNSWIGRLFGNASTVIPVIIAFIVLFVVLGVRCSHAGELHLETGAQLVTGRGPYVGLYYAWSDPVLERVGFEVGTQMFGSTNKTANNWSPFAALTVGRGPVGAGIGFAYLQNIDALDGSHLNYTLFLRSKTPWQRVGVSVRHISNAGTTESNVGRNMLAIDWRLQ